MLLAGHDLNVNRGLVIDAASSIKGGRLARTGLVQNRRMPWAIFAGCDEPASAHSWP